MFRFFGMCVKLKSVNQIGKKVAFSGIMSSIKHGEHTILQELIYKISHIHTSKLIQETQREQIIFPNAVCMFSRV